MLRYCFNLTDGGLKEILRLSDNKLRALDVYNMAGIQGGSTSPYAGGTAPGRV